MTGSGVLLAYAGWAAAPLVAYAALSFGLRRALRGFLLLFAGYSAAIWSTWAALVQQNAEQGAVVTLAPGAVIAPWAGVAVLSALLYGLGAWIGGGE